MKNKQAHVKMYTIDSCLETNIGERKEWLTLATSVTSQPAKR